MTDETNRSVFLIHWNGRGPIGSVVARFPSRKDAETYANDGLPGDRTAHVVETELDLADRTLFSAPILVTIFNAITDSKVKRFASRDAGASWLFRALSDRYGAIDYTQIEAPAPVVPAGKPAKPSKKTSITSNAAHKSKETISLVDIPKIRPEQVITVNRPNDKRAGTEAYRSYELMHYGMTVAEYRRLNGHPGQLWWNAKRGYVTLSDPAPAVTPAPVSDGT
jgi:hypothetical protein